MSSPTAGITHPNMLTGLSPGTTSLLNDAVAELLNDGVAYQYYQFTPRQLLVMLRNRNLRATYRDALVIILFHRDDNRYTHHQLLNMATARRLIPTFRDALIIVLLQDDQTRFRADFPTEANFASTRSPAVVSSSAQTEVAFHAVGAQFDPQALIASMEAEVC